MHLMNSSGYLPFRLLTANCWQPCSELFVDSGESPV